LRHLRHFVEREGHARIAALQLEDGYRLGRWVSKQRTDHASGQLDADRVGGLEAVSGWKWDPLADQWGFYSGFRGQMNDRS